MEAIFKLLQDKTDEERASIAAEILSDCDPNLNNLASFIANLDDSSRDELYNRLETWYEQNA